MRVLVQRVTSARVLVDGAVVGAIAPDGQGLLTLVGVTHTDDASVARKLAEKLWQLRILDEERSAADVGAPILVVSQFTLYANTVKGMRPRGTRPRPVRSPSRWLTLSPMLCVSLARTSRPAYSEPRWPSN